MTPTVETTLPTPPSAGGAVFRSCLVGVLVAAAVIGGLALSGLLGEREIGFAVTGGVAALITSGIGMAVLVRCTTVRDEGDSGRLIRLYLTGLGVNLGLQAVTVVVALLIFSSRGEKFAALAAFGLSFALSSICLLYTSPSPRDRTRSRMPSSA